VNKYMRWNDPDDGACSGNVEVLAEVQTGVDYPEVVRVRKTDAPEGETFEVFASELGEPRRFYKTTVTFTVLSEEPIPPHADLQSIAVECNEGQYVGNFFACDQQLLNGGAMADELYEAGSEPGFFSLDDSGQDV
jgi:hypothetical protein